jgi:hypothetical protein
VGESALGTLRIEGLELEPEGHDILDRFAGGEISLPEIRNSIRAYTATIVRAPAFEAGSCNDDEELQLTTGPC